MRHDALAGRVLVDEDVVGGGVRRGGEDAQRGEARRDGRRARQPRRQRGADQHVRGRQRRRVRLQPPVRERRPALRGDLGVRVSEAGRGGRGGG